MALDSRDARAVLEVATALADTPAPGFEDVLGLLRSLIPCDSASFNDMAMATRDFRYAIVPPAAASLVARLKPHYDAWAFQHPLINAAAAHPSLGAVRLADVAGGDRFTLTDLYREFYLPFDIRFQLAIQLPAPPDTVVAYVLNRSRAAGEFAPRDVAIMNALSGLLAMHHRTTIGKDRSDILAAELEKSAWAVVSVRSDGLVEASSTSELRAGAAVPPPLAAIVSAHGEPSQGASRHQVRVDGQDWHCVVHPVPLGPTVLLMRRIGNRATDIDRLIAAGLTARQAVVLWELAHTGGSNGEIARQVGIAEGTVKKHLDTVFKELDVTSRAAAILRAREITA